jgi:predicted RNA-binding protein with EMAP domain
MSDETPKVEIFSKDAKNEIEKIIWSYLKDTALYNYTEFKDRVENIVKICLQEKDWEDRRKKNDAKVAKAGHLFLIFLGVVAGVAITLTVVKGFGL